MAPYRGSKAAAQAADNDDNDQPDWDSSSRNLALVLARATAWPAATSASPPASELASTGASASGGGGAIVVDELEPGLGAAAGGRF